MGRAKEWGFYASRKRERGRGRRRLGSAPGWFWALAFIGLLLTAGAMRGWPQSSEWLLNSSGSDLLTWEKLSLGFRSGLDEQSTRLRQALTELETSQADLRTLTSLLERSLRANERLRSYNEQIAERMRERDEDLAAAYGDIQRLRAQRLRLIMGVSASGLIAAGMAVIKLIKFCM